LEEATSQFIVCEKSIAYHLIQSPTPAHIPFWGEKTIGNLSREKTKDNKVMEGKKKLADWLVAEGRISGVCGPCRYTAAAAAAAAAAAGASLTYVPACTSTYLISLVSFFSECPLLPSLLVSW
jgi:hypothetical protein